MSQLDKLGKVDLMIAPVAVDFADSKGYAFDAKFGIGSPLDMPTAADLDNTTQALLSLKRDRDGTDTAVDISCEDISVLRQDRQDALLLSRLISQRLGAGAIYLFADLRSLGEADPTMLYRSAAEDGVDYITRAEETLAPAVDDIIASLKRTSELPGAEHCVDDELVLHYVNGNKQSKAVPLKGYTLNRKSTDPKERMHFSDAPSCASLMAAAALEQMELADHTIRILPSSMRDRDVVARDVLRLASMGDSMAITTAILSSSGDVGRYFYWGSAPPDEVRRELAELKSHRASTAMSKRVHDGVFKAQADMFRASREGAVSPSQISQINDIYNRAEAFLSSGVQAGVLLESDASSDTESILKDLREMLAKLFNSTNQNVHPVSAEVVEHHDGYLTNSACRSRITFHGRLRTDKPTADSATAHVHLVHEYADSLEVIDDISEITNLGSALRFIGSTPPRYIMLEVSKARQ